MGIGVIEEPALMSSSVNLANKPNPLYALKSDYDSNPRQETSSVEVVNSNTDIPGVVELDRTAIGVVPLEQPESELLYVFNAHIDILY
jgi:hypothetical protein